MKLIGKGDRHRDTAQTKVTLREVVEVAKAFEATTFADKLKKTAGAHRKSRSILRVNQHLQVKTRDQHRHCVTGAAAVINSPANSIAQHLARDATGAALLVISPELVEEEQDLKDGISNQILSKMIQAKKRSLRTVGETTPQHRRKFFARLHLIQGGKIKVVKAQIDSTSTCNTMPSSLLNELFPDAKISKTRSKINIYGSETMRPKGQVTPASAVIEKERYT